MMKLTHYQQDVINARICPYCKGKTIATTEAEIYNREYSGRAIIRCRQWPLCDAYVGCHDDGTPLGRLAAPALRQAKKQAHNVFDRL